MKRYLVLPLVLSLALMGSVAQTSSQTENRDWFDMMLDRQTPFFETQKAFYDFWQGKTPAKGMGYNVFKRWEYYWSSRVDAAGNFPQPDLVKQEYQRFIQEYSGTNGLKLSEPIWQELGPRNRNGHLGYMGIGRVNAIAFDPVDTAKIYVGAPAGGFWITENSGQSWTSHTDILPTMGVSAIAVNQENPDLILIGTGDRDGGNDWGIGTMISEDGGVSWTLSNEGMGEITVGFFAQHETDPQTLLAAANGGIFKTTDFGQSWTRTSSDTQNYRDIKYKPGSPSIAYASSNTGFFRSTDGGNSWTQITEGITASGRIVIGVSRDAPEKVYLVIGGTFQGCFLSTNSGQSFTMRSNSPNILGGAYAGDDTRNQSWYDLYLHVDPYNSNILHVGGINTWRSDDGGSTWTITSHWSGDRANEVHADHHCVAYNYLNNRMYDGNDGGIYWTDDQGVSWNDISVGLGIGQMYKLGVSATNRDKAMAGFQDNGSATLTDHGWISTGGGDGFECAIDPFTDGYSYSSIYYGDITRWINNSEALKIAGDGRYGINEKGAWVTPYTLSEWDGSTMIIGYKNIWISRNVKDSGPIKWQKISNNLGGSNSTNCAVVECSPADSNLFYFARQDGKLFKTENLLANTVWVELTPNKPGNGTPSDLECHPYEKNTLFMTLGNRIYKSTDQGSSWVDISFNLPNIPFNDVAYDRSSKEGLYLATDAGVYYKDADSEQWRLFGLNLPASVEVTELEIYYGRSSRSECRLRASTYGRGMWEVELAPVENVVLPPYFLNALKDQNDVELSWNPPHFPNRVQTYSIYRNGEKIASTSGTAYLDRKTPENSSLLYQVTAVYTDGSESGPSNQVFIQAPIQLPYEQSFENGSDGWKALFTSLGWRLGSSEDLNIAGRDGLFFGINSGFAADNEHVSDYLFTPSIKLAEYSGQTISLRFQHAFRVYRNYDKLSVVYRTEPSAPWVKIEQLQATASNSWTWKEKELSLPPEALVDGVQIGFFYDDSNQHAWGAAVDDVQLFHNTTSIAEIDLIHNLVVYPNPSEGCFLVELELKKMETLQMRLLDIQGKTVWRSEIQPESLHPSITVELKNASAGRYNLEITGESFKASRPVVVR